MAALHDKTFSKHIGIIGTIKLVNWLFENGVFENLYSNALDSMY
jgi:hypothetical protein